MCTTNCPTAGGSDGTKTYHHASLEVCTQAHIQYTSERNPPPARLSAQNITQALGFALFIPKNSAPRFGDPIIFGTGELFEHRSPLSLGWAHLPKPASLAGFGRWPASGGGKRERELSIFSLKAPVLRLCILFLCNSGRNRLWLATLLQGVTLPSRQGLLRTKICCAGCMVRPCTRLAPGSVW